MAGSLLLAFPHSIHHLSYYYSSESIDASGIPVLIALLVILSFDAIPSHLRQAIVYATEALLAPAHIPASVELATCRLLNRLVTSPFMMNAKQTDVFSTVTGGTRRSSRIRRWLAWALLGGSLNMEESQWGDMPPLCVFVGLFDRQTSGTVKLFMTKETDYEELTLFVEILAVALTDIDLYMQKECNSASLEKIGKSLEKLMGNIGETMHASFFLAYARFFSRYSRGASGSHQGQRDDEPTSQAAHIPTRCRHQGKAKREYRQIRTVFYSTLTFYTH